MLGTFLHQPPAMTRLPQLWVATAVLLLLCASSTSAGRLLSSWSSWTGGPFTLTEISAQSGRRCWNVVNPKSNSRRFLVGQQGKVLGTATGIIEFFAGNPGIDYGRSRAYFAVITGQVSFCFSTGCQCAYENDILEHNDSNPCTCNRCASWLGSLKSQFRNALHEDPSSTIIHNVHPARSPDRLAIRRHSRFLQRYLSRSLRSISSN